MKRFPRIYYLNKNEDLGQGQSCPNYFSDELAMHNTSERQSKNVKGPHGLKLSTFWSSQLNLIWTEN